MRLYLTPGSDFRFSPSLGEYGLKLFLVSILQGFQLSLISSPHGGREATDSINIIFMDIKDILTLT